MDTLQYILLALLIGYLFWVRSKDKREIETYKSYSETMMLMVRELKQEVEVILSIPGLTTCTSDPILAINDPPHITYP